MNKASYYSNINYCIHNNTIYIDEYIYNINKISIFDTFVKINKLHINSNMKYTFDYIPNNIKIITYISNSKISKYLPLILNNFLINCKTYIYHNVSKS